MGKSFDHLYYKPSINYKTKAVWKVCINSKKNIQMVTKVFQQPNHLFSPPPPASTQWLCDSCLLSPVTTKGSSVTKFNLSDLRGFLLAGPGIIRFCVVISFCVFDSNTLQSWTIWKPQATPTLNLLFFFFWLFLQRLFAVIGFAFIFIYFYFCSVLEKPNSRTYADGWGKK